MAALMGDEAEARSQVHAIRVGDGPVVPVDGEVRMRVIPPDDDEYVAIRAVELVGKLLQHETLGRAVVRRDGGFVVVDYPDAGPFHRTHIRADGWVRVKRGAVT